MSAMPAVGVFHRSSHTKKSRLGNAFHFCREFDMHMKSPVEHQPAFTGYGSPVSMAFHTLVSSAQPCHQPRSG